MLLKSDYYNGKRQKEIFLVLVPHRDVRVELRKYSETMAGSGINGVYNFPWVAPLASLSKPLSIDELKHFALFLRETTGTDKINTAEINTSVFPVCRNNGALIGPRLDLDIPAGTLEKTQKVNRFFSPIVIGAFLNLNKDNEQLLKIFHNSALPCKKLSFRAAAVANMYWQPLNANEETGYKWKIEKLCWLANPASPDWRR